MTGRRLAWAGIGLVIVVALTVGGLGDPGPRTPQERVRSIGLTVACPQCDGQSVADSNATSAINIRGEIARQVQDGRTDDEIRESIAASFGDQVLLIPSRSGFAGLVWFVPVLVGVLALAALVAQFRRWKRQPSGPEPSDEDRALVERARHR